MNSTCKTEYFYDCATRREGKYTLAWLTIHYREESEGYRGLPYIHSDRIVTINWQTTDDTARDDGKHYWYAAEMKIETPYFAHVKKAAAVIARIEKKLNDEGYYTTIDIQPGKLIDILSDLKIKYRVYDPRTHQHELPVDVYPHEYDRYINDYDRDGTGTCKYEAIATEETQAKMIIAASAATAGDMKFMETWTAAGMPVKKVSTTWGSNYPDYRAPHEILTHPSDIEKSKVEYTLTV